MSTIDLSNYKELYLTTSQEQLQKINQGISLLQADVRNKEGIDAVYINSHTLVSKSMIMGYSQIGLLSQTIEKIFYKVKNNQFQLTSQILEKITQSAEKLSEALVSIKNDNKEIDLSSQIAALGEFV
jgi:two-component system chemotaxis sensor kinase CheA